MPYSTKSLANQKVKREEIVKRWLKIWTANYGRELTRELAKTTLDAVGDIHPDLLDDACMRTHQEVRGFPSIADIRSHVRFQDAVGFLESRYVYDEFDNCRKGFVTDEICFIPPRGRDPGGLAHIRCGCGNCAPENWCSMQSGGERCKEPVMIDRIKRTRSTLCAGHVFNADRPIESKLRQFREHLDWEKLAERLCLDVGGKEGFMQLREAMGWDRKKFDDAIMGKDEQDKARRRALSKQMQTPDDIPI